MGSRKKKQPEKQNTSLSESLQLIILLVVALLLISNFGFGGSVGNTVSKVIFGIMGVLAYAFPFVILLISLMLIYFKKDNLLGISKVVGSCLLLIFLCMFASLIVYGANPPSPILAFKDSFSQKSGGGIIGGTLSFLLVKGFGIIGAYLIDIILILISVILIAERSFLEPIAAFGRSRTEAAAEARERRRRKQEEEELSEDVDVEDDPDAEEAPAPKKRRGRRTDNKVRGVSSDTRIEEYVPEPEDDEMGEITVETYPVQPEAEDNYTADTNDENVHEIHAEDLDQTIEDKVEKVGTPKIRERSRVSVTSKPSGRHVKAEEPDDILDLNEDIEDLDSYEPDTDTADDMHSYVEDIFDRQIASGEDLVKVPEEDLPEGPTRKPKKYLSDAENQKNEAEIQQDIAASNDLTPPPAEYIFPDINLLKPGKNKGNSNNRENLQKTAQKLEQTMRNFGVDARVTDYSCGPAVTRFEIQPEIGVKVSKIVNLADDIKLNLAVADIRIEAPIPGKSAVGIEVPNAESTVVPFRDLIDSEEFRRSQSKITFAVGKDIAGNVKVTDIAKMPHLLIAGATGSGKSVCINTIIMSILYKARPDEVKMIMIDPKVVELSVYNGIPHLLLPVVTDPRKAAGSLQWAVTEMTNRYNAFAESHVRDIKGYNARIETIDVPEGQERPKKMPQIIIIVDELADLMMVASKDVEESICRLAQLARAAGIHLIIATQRPSVNVITGLIKANMPSRIAFAVTSGIDSRTILDMNGAEKLLGKGDMLFDPQGAPKPMRVQGAFVSDDEVSDVVTEIKEKNGIAETDDAIVKQIDSAAASQGTSSAGTQSAPEADNGEDPLFIDAAKIIVDKEKASIGMLQRYLKIGFNRAARIMDQLEEAGVVGAEEGTKPRAVLMSKEQFENYLEEIGR